MTIPEPSGRGPHEPSWRVGLWILVGVLGAVPTAMLVIGLATRRWEVAVAAIAMVAFFAASGRASWVNAQGRAALIGGELRQARNRRTVAALWGLAGLVALAVAIAVLALQP